MTAAETPNSKRQKSLNHQISNKALKGAWCLVFGVCGAPSGVSYS
jgi:hypothetical protein